MLRHTSKYLAESITCKLTISEDLFYFLDSNRFNFVLIRPNLLVAKMSKPFVQITVNFPAEFVPGNETLLRFQSHQNPRGTVEQRFSFRPTFPSDVPTHTAEEFFYHIAGVISLCDVWDQDIRRALGVAAPTPEPVIDLDEE